MFPRDFVYCRWRGGRRIGSERWWSRGPESTRSSDSPRAQKGSLSKVWSTPYLMTRGSFWSGGFPSNGRCSWPKSDRTIGPPSYLIKSDGREASWKNAAIYDSKCKINVKWWKIKMKTRNLTQSSLRNDPINRRMHGFSFRIFEEEDEVQDVISPHSFNQILISNPPRTRKRVKKRSKSMDAWIVVSRQFDFTRKSKGTFLFEEQFYL